MDKNFFKRNYKLISLFILIVVLAIIIGTQIKFKTPEQVKEESVPLVEDTVEESTPRQLSVTSIKDDDEVPEITVSVQEVAEVNEKTATMSTLDVGSSKKADALSDSSLKYKGQSWEYVGDRYQPLISQKVYPDKKINVNVTVECLSVLGSGVECNNQDMWQYVPSDGYIVHKTLVECSLGENVWDAVARVLNANQIDYAYTGDPPFTHGVQSVSTVYGTCYVYRCNHLEAGEAAAGKKGPFGNEYAGWTYTVNGVYPGLGMNGVVMKDNDNIVFKYYTGYTPFEMDVEGNF